MQISSTVLEFAKADVLERFLRYVTIDTTASRQSETNPTTPNQRVLADLLAGEARALGYNDVHVDEHSFVYIKVPASKNVTAEPIGLLAHVDTSPDQSGEHVRPQLHKQWDGNPIRFPDDPELKLSIAESAELEKSIGDTIITASGKTLLGSDDKAGVAEIMTALACWIKFPELLHGDVTACFTHDEEVGKGVLGIDLKRLPKFCYTLDGGEPGEIEGECFDAWQAKIAIQGIGVHPGYAKDKMINAVTVAAQIISRLPSAETPERTSDRQGFIHVGEISGSNESAEIMLILRDFEPSENERRKKLLDGVVAKVTAEYRGVNITVKYTHQYENMRQYLAPYPQVTEHARRATRKAGLEPVEKLIRGGTDGARLAAQGHPTPNIFAGEMMIHSRREWIAHKSLTKSVETILYLATEWTGNWSLVFLVVGIGWGV